MRLYKEIFLLSAHIRATPNSYTQKLPSNLAKERQLTAVCRTLKAISTYKLNLHYHVAQSHFLLVASVPSEVVQESAAAFCQQQSTVAEVDWTHPKA